MFRFSVAPFSSLPRKNCVELIELGEVFALEKFPSQREATHTLQSWRNSQSWQKFGRGTNFAWQNREADVPNRLILVKCLCPAKWGKVSSEKLNLSFQINSSVSECTLGNSLLVDYIIQNKCL